MNMNMNDEILAEGKYLRFVRREGWEFIERTTCSGVVAVVAVTSEDELLLVEQYRPPLRSQVLELPAGLSGDSDGAEGEDPAEAARRELLEETGYEAQEMRLLTEGPTSPGATTEVIGFYHAHPIRKVASGGGVDNEKITVHRVPLTSAVEWLEERAKSGVLVDLKIYTGLFFLLNPAGKEKSSWTSESK